MKDVRQKGGDEVKNAFQYVDIGRRPTKSPTKSPTKNAKLVQQRMQTLTVWQAFCGGIIVRSTTTKWTSLHSFIKR
ncbi:anaerobic ribonucleoside-triphosphate reductase activating protein [Sesbania bispinosa]|nr:anaerobic ribonucleoside-triphosphate reductase activating protein [Sesbania bispinosa]